MIEQNLHLGQRFYKTWI